jgi:hypothetical protein
MEETFFAGNQNNRLVQDAVNFGEKIDFSLSGSVHRKLCFYLPHMEYEGSIGFVSRKMKKFYCWFSRFRTFYG